MRHDPLHPASSNIIVVGRMGGVHGVMGWIKLQSFTDPLDNIFNYQPWYVGQQGQWQPFQISNKKKHHKQWLIQPIDTFSREQALAYVNQLIGVEKSCLPTLDAGEYYWRDLVGLKVTNTLGISLGVIDYLFETQTHDVMVIVGQESESGLAEKVEKNKANKENEKSDKSARKVTKTKEKQHLIPYSTQYIISINIEKAQMIVDWDADF